MLNSLLLITHLPVIQHGKTFSWVMPAPISLQQLHGKTRLSVGGPQYFLDYWVYCLAVCRGASSNSPLIYMKWLFQLLLREMAVMEFIAVISQILYQHCIKTTIIASLCELSNFSDKNYQDIRIISYILPCSTPCISCCCISAEPLDLRLGSIQLK